MQNYAHQLVNLMMLHVSQFLVSTNVNTKAVV